MSEFTVDDLKRMFANPFYAINISEGLFGDHQLMVTKDEWVQAAIKTIIYDYHGNPFGFDEKLVKSLTEWLYTLLNVLEGDYVA